MLHARAVRMGSTRNGYNNRVCWTIIACQSATERPATARAGMHDRRTAWQKHLRFAVAVVRHPAAVALAQLVRRCAFAAARLAAGRAPVTVAAAQPHV